MSTVTALPATSLPAPFPTGRKPHERKMLKRRLRADVERLEKTLADPRVNPFAHKVLVLDEFQGRILRRRAYQLWQQGNMSWEEAKAQVHPKCPGVSFLDVYLRALDMPTIPVFGSSMVLYEEQVPFLWKRALVKAILNLSHVDGGGPKAMAGGAYLAQRARQVVTAYLTERTARNFRVLLLVGDKEEPHKWCSNADTVWGIDALVGRTQALYSLGRSIIAEAEAGGFGTGEELFIGLTMNQLRGKGRLKCPFRDDVPLLLMDFTLPGKQRSVWEGIMNWIEDAKAYGTIRPDDTRYIHRLVVTDPDALEQYLAILGKAYAKHLGYNAVAGWENETGMSLLKFVNELAEAHPAIDDTMRQIMQESGQKK